MTAIEIPCAPAPKPQRGIKEANSDCDRESYRYVAANNENMRKLSTNDQKWLCHRLFKQALNLMRKILS